MKIFNYDANNGLLLGESMADQSPLEDGVFLVPANATEIEPLANQEGKTIHFEGGQWVYKDIPVELPKEEPIPPVLTYAELRAAEYPPITDYLDGVVKGDQAQIDKYIADCQAVKAKYPKGI